MSLDRPNEAVDCCDRCLFFGKDNQGVQAIRERAIKVRVAKEEKEREKRERVQKEIVAKQVMNAALQVMKLPSSGSVSVLTCVITQERNIIPMVNRDRSENLYAPHFDPEDPAKGTLIFPTFFLYPQHATSDLIPNFVEDTTFAAHITNIFPSDAPAPQWDKNREYVDGSLVVYATTHQKRLLKIGKEMTLRDVCRAAGKKDRELMEGLELKDGCLMFVVLPKGDMEQKWVQDFKDTRNS